MTKRLLVDIKLVIDIPYDETLFNAAENIKSMLYSEHTWEELNYNYADCEVTVSKMYFSTEGAIRFAEVDENILVQVPIYATRDDVPDDVHLFIVIYGGEQPYGRPERSEILSGGVYHEDGSRSWFAHTFDLEASTEPGSFIYMQKPYLKLLFPSTIH